MGRGCSPAAEHRLLTAVVSLVAELRGLGPTGATVVAHGLGCSVARAVFLDQGSNHARITRCVLNHETAREAQKCSLNPWITRESQRLVSQPMGANDVHFQDTPHPAPPHLEKPAWPQICSQNLGGDDGVGRGSPGVASMQPQWPACLVASTFPPFKAVGRWFRRTGSQYGGTQAQNLDSPLLVCSALHSTSPVLLMGESLGRGNENKPRLKFQHPAFLRV